MSNKEKYQKFCKNIYIPIFSQSWWLDAICGEESWDVWLYENGNQILAAMPYYREQRGNYQYITKALLSQNNGIIFSHAEDAKQIAKYAFEEKVIDAACQFIDSLGLDVYEQQYHYSFYNWLPFFWNRYTAIVRYTYVLEDLSNLDDVWNGMSSKYRKNIKKGQKNATIKTGLDPELFYKKHEQVFLRQGLACPFSYEQWIKLYNACKINDAGEIFYAETPEGNIASVLFLIWDTQSVYLLLGGSMPGFQNLETYDAIIWEGIKLAAEKGLKFDFEGSVIKRISKSYREFGGTPKAYYRIRKVFNPDIMRAETEKIILDNKKCEEVNINGV